MYQNQQNVEHRIHLPQHLTPIQSKMIMMSLKKLIQIQNPKKVMMILKLSKLIQLEVEQQEIIHKKLKHQKQLIRIFSIMKTIKFQLKFLIMILKIPPNHG